MIKLVYDLKIGFKELYLTMLDDEYELNPLVDGLKYQVLQDMDTGEYELEEYEVAEYYKSEEAFYNRFKDDLEGLLEELQTVGVMDMWREETTLDYTKLYFGHIFRAQHCVAGIWEPSNIRLVYEPDTPSSFAYLNGLSAKETCDLLKMSRQQLHYYVKTGQIRKAYDPDNPTKYTYNHIDVYTLYSKLANKYN